MRKLTNRAGAQSSGPSFVLSSCVRVHNSIAMTELAYSSNCVEQVFSEVRKAPVLCSRMSYVEYRGFIALHT
jgi:hypothetical protein